MSEKSVTVNGTPILGLLGITFIVLKLCGVINWSWWWVLAPFWGGFALVIIILLGALIVAAIAAMR